MTDAPERIWACVSKNTKSGVVTLLGDATFPVDGWQEYVRADRIEELTAELAGARDDAKGAEAKALRAAADMTLGLSNARACRTAILAMIPKGESHDPL